MNFQTDRWITAEIPPATSRFFFKRKLKFAATSAAERPVQQEGLWPVLDTVLYRADLPTSTSSGRYQVLLAGASPFLWGRALA